MRAVLLAAIVAVLALAGASAGVADPPPKPQSNFDLEGHRGTRGLRPENTLAAFGKALQIGVTTLELDTGVTKDGVVVVSHERRISPLECQGPWVGQLIRDLTYAQIQKLDCGTRHPPNPATDPFVGTQEAVPGTHMPALAQVFALANRYGADDVLITDYPNIGRDVMAQKGLKLPSRYASPFDVEGHRGARAYRPENTIPAFAYALSRHVTTIETDTGVTKDGVLVISHNRAINAVRCHDTPPAFAGDPMYPYAGDLIKDLTLAQIKTLDCGFTDPGFPRQVRVTTTMPTLQELFDFVKTTADYPIRFNIETKISPLVADTVPYDVFTRKLVDAIRSNGLEDRAMIQSFDWRTIMLAKKLDPKIETVALVWQFGAPDCQTLADECSLEARVGDPSLKSPWTGGLDWWKYQDLGKLVSMAKADVVSSNWQVHDPNLGYVASTDWYLKEDPAMFHGPTVDVLQRHYHLRVVPYTIDDEATMQRVINLDVDGIISDDPDLLILVAKRNGLA